MNDDLLQLITGRHSAPQLIPWMHACEALFLLVAILFVWTALRRDRMDSAITSDGTQSSKFPTVPERRWTYDHDYMVRFLETLCRRAPDTRASSFWLEFYAGPILKMDIAFAVSFAAFIVFASLLTAFYFGAIPWLLRASFVTSGMGIVYGFADVAEDLKLQSILRNAATVYARKIRDVPDELETSLADAAEVDAANALTRIKTATLSLSLVGLVAFGVLQGLAALMIFVSNQASGGGQKPPDKVRLPVGGNG
jgi:hypothetical protein